MLRKIILILALVLGVGTLAAPMKYAFAEELNRGTTGIDVGLGIDAEIEAGAGMTAGAVAQETAQKFETGCDKEGYYLNSEGDCRKIKICKAGYAYVATTNSCHKITCPFGYKAGEDQKCHKLICDTGYIISVASSTCVQNKGKDFSECEAGLAYDTKTKKCVEIPEGAVSTGASTSNGVLDGMAVAPLSIAEEASTSATVTGVADISLPIYAELRALIIENLKEQARLEAEEDEAARQESEEEMEGGDGADDGADDEDTAEVAKTCPEGKVLNPATNRCRTAVTVTKNSTSIITTTFDPETGETTTVKTCVEGYYLNADTNRCNKMSSGTDGGGATSGGNSSSGGSKKCGPDQFLNPLTNRCKKLTTVTSSSTSTTVTTYDPLTGKETVVKTCIEGYELNEETNRCKKIKENTGADYALDLPDLGVIAESPKTFIGVTVAAVATAGGVGFAVFQFRKEIVRGVRKVAAKIRMIGKR